jgi:hypothetical protein
MKTTPITQKIVNGQPSSRVEIVVKVRVEVKVGVVAKVGVVVKVKVAVRLDREWLG